MEQSHLAMLVQVSDALDWSPDRTDSFVDAVELVRAHLGAALAPAYLLDATGDKLVLVTDEEQTAALGEHFRDMPAREHVREPWINPQEWPVQASDHLDDEAWRLLPDDFKAWFGEYGVVASLHADRRHLGAVLLCFDGPRALTDDERDFLAAAGRILGAAVNRWQTSGRERELAALEERRRLSDELHDDLSQRVAALGLHVDMTAMDLDSAGDQQVRADVDKLRELVADLKDGLRHQMLGLRSDADLTAGSFIDQVRALVANFRDQFAMDIAVECRPDCDDTSVPLPVAAQLVRVLREALANAHQHARARRVVVRFRPSSTRIRIEVDDDGAGFDPAAVPASRLGIRIMSERLHQLDGVLRFAAREGGGTVLTAEVPLAAGDRQPIPAGLGS